MVDELLNLLFQPLLVIFTNAVFMGSASTMGFPNRWGIMGKKFITVVTIVSTNENR